MSTSAAGVRTVVLRFVLCKSDGKFAMAVASFFRSFKRRSKISSLSGAVTLSFARRFCTKSSWCAERTVSPMSSGLTSDSILSSASKKDSMLTGVYSYCFCCWKSAPFSMPASFPSASFTSFSSINLQCLVQYLKGTDHDES